MHNPLPDADSPPPSSKNAKRVRPRDAATLIIVRRDGPQPRLLMGRRNNGHDFMPGKWVFPGGRIDRSDFHAPYASDLRPEVMAKLEKTGPHARMRALALTAVRETFEEVGLLLAKPAPARPGAGAWREFVNQGAAPDLEAMDFVARAITPHYLPKHFDARFFMADAERLTSLERQPDCGELDEIAWFEFEAALELDLPGVTRFVLGEAAQRLEHPDRPVPFLRFLHGSSRLAHL
ncbi:MAG: NUDIX domain-containing protein [Caulobacteraceae bacterium]|nr:NUDIX domain-containing protein [Caulobacteraceae bacterium]